MRTAGDGTVQGRGSASQVFCLRMVVGGKESSPGGDSGSESCSGRRRVTLTPAPMPSQKHVTAFYPRVRQGKLCRHLCCPLLPYLPCLHLTTGLYQHAPCYFLRCALSLAATRVWSHRPKWVLIGHTRCRTAVRRSPPCINDRWNGRCSHQLKSSLLFSAISSSRLLLTLLLLSFKLDILAFSSILANLPRTCAYAELTESAAEHARVQRQKQRSFVLPRTDSS